jgi:hypothetical protein
MPFREKTAWISLVTMLALFGAFYVAVAAGRVPSAGVVTIRYLLLTVGAVIVLQVVANAVAAGLSGGDDPRSPRDERERLIELKATRIAFYVLILGVFTVMFVFIHTPLMGYHPRLPQIGLGTLAAVVLADVVKNAAQIVYFRRGA